MPLIPATWRHSTIVNALLRIPNYLIHYHIFAPRDTTPTTRPINNYTAVGDTTAFCERPRYKLLRVVRAARLSHGKAYTPLSCALRGSWSCVVDLWTAMRRTYHCVVYEQDMSAVSLPLHATLSKKMDPFPCPK